MDDELPQVQPNAESNALNSDFKDSVEELFISIPISSNQLPSADLASTSNQVEPNIFTTAHA
ncbi:MAG: hypothetical protein HC840_25070 [Leptolyngbyaceae cyanobacterium RM2_2_4]|nr:hypothetical protein [Leptolyngbyaceae cyanobacterium RM2_2_4]